MSIKEFFKNLITAAGVLLFVYLYTVLILLIGG